MYAVVKTESDISFVTFIISENRLNCYSILKTKIIKILLREMVCFYQISFYNLFKKFKICPIFAILFMSLLKLKVIFLLLLLLFIIF